MKKPEINTRQVELSVRTMKNMSATGPDGLKPEMYEALVKTTEGLQTLTRCMITKLTASSNPSSWKSSRTKMIPKVSKPTAKQL